MLKVAWATPPAVLPGNGNEIQGMRALDSAGQIGFRLATVNFGNVNDALASAAHVVTRTYHWPTNLHAPIGPCCAVADVTPQGASDLQRHAGRLPGREHRRRCTGLPASTGARHRGTRWAVPSATGRST